MYMMTLETLSYSVFRCRMENSNRYQDAIAQYLGRELELNREGGTEQRY